MGSLKSWAVVEQFFSASLSVADVAFLSVGCICEAGRRDPLLDSFANSGGNLAGVDAVRDVAGEMVKPLLDGTVKLAGGLLAGMDGFKALVEDTFNRSAFDGDLAGGLAGDES